jgi:hypothetical protein
MNTENKMNTNSNTEVAEQLSTTDHQQFHAFDQREVNEGTVYLNEEPYLPNPKLGMETSAFNVPDIMGQPIHFRSSIWASTSLAGAQIDSFAYSDMVSSSSSIQKMLLQTFTYFKPVYKVRITVNATRFHCGKLFAFWDPLNILGSRSVFAGDISPINQWSASCMPHAIIDAADSNPVEFTIPYEYFQSCLSTARDAQELGSMRIVVLNPLQFPEGSSDSLVINYWMWAEEAALDVPNIPHKIFATPVSQKASIYNDKGRRIPNQTHGLLKTVTGKLTDLKGTANTVVGAVSDIASGNIRGLANRVLDFFNLDKPALIESRIGNHLATVSPFCHMVGSDNTVRLSAVPGSGYVETDYSAAPKDDMCISSIIQKPCLIDQFTWSSDQLINTQIYDTVVTPTQYGQSVSTPKGTFFRFFPTLFSYFSWMFEQFTGDIIYRIDVAATQFHSGRLGIYFSPDVAVQVLTPEPITNANSNLPNLVFDLRETKEITFRVSYNGVTPRKLTRNGLHDDPVQLNAGSYALGRITISVLNPLATTESIPNSIQVNVWQCAGENFKYMIPRVRHDTMLYEDAVAYTPPASSVSRLRSIFETPGISMPSDQEIKNLKNQTHGLPEPLENQMEVNMLPKEEEKNLIKALENQENKDLIPNQTHAGELNDSDVLARSNKVTAPNILKGPSGLNMPDFYNEILDDVRDLCRRYRYYLFGKPSVPLETGGYTKGSVFNFSVHPDIQYIEPTSTRFGAAHTFSTLICKLYAFWSGSMRYKIVPITSRNTPCIAQATYTMGEPDPLFVANDGLYDLTAYGGYPLHLQNVSQDAALEIEVPFYSIKTQLATQTTLNAAVSNDISYYSPGAVQVALIYNSDAAPDTTKYLLAQAIGDDFAFRVLVAPPSLYNYAG